MNMLSQFCNLLSIKIIIVVVVGASSPSVWLSSLFNPHTLFFPSRGNNEDIECVDNFCNVARWRNSSWQNGGEMSGLNLINPVRKDTIIVPTGG